MAILNVIALFFCGGVAVYQFSTGNVALGIMNIALALIQLPFIFRG